MMTLQPTDILPLDYASSHLVGRVWDPESGGPRVVAIRGDHAIDLTSATRTMSALLECADPVQRILESQGGATWRLDALLNASLAQDASRPYFLAPIDLQVVKACGVTFVESMLERVIEERCAGDVTRAAEVRTIVMDAVGGSLSSLKPGSEEAQRVKAALVGQGMWSQYLEVGIGPNPEVFTKAPVLSSVGIGAHVGIPTFSSWNNPEPELVLIANGRGRLQGATLGNDVNLRDVEGRSALLLGMAKDNNASSAIGPFIRLFDGTFTVDSLRTEEITLDIRGDDGYILRGHNNLGRISRPFEELVGATFGPHHQYPDGFALFTGTLFAPKQDRDAEGLGFTHKTGDVVTIRSPHLGALVNRTGVAELLPEWRFGIGEMLAYHSRLDAEARRPDSIPAGKI